MMIGQYDGDGRWMAPCGSPPPRYSMCSRRWSLWSSPMSYLRYHHSSSDATDGSMSKLWTGGGDEVPHSRVRASHGSGSVQMLLRLLTTLKTKTRKPAAIVNAPIEATRFQKSHPMPSGYVALRPGIP